MTTNSPGGVQGSAVDYDPFAGEALARVVPTTEPQREVWLADRLGREASLAFNESVTLRLAGPLDERALATALAQLVVRHDALRATPGNDGTEFLVAATGSLPLVVSDLATLDPAAREAALDAARREAVRSPFDLEQGPLARAHLLRLAATDHALVLTFHHIVCDGWSFGVLLRELGSLYTAASGGAQPTLGAPASYADFALREQAYAGGEAHAADEAFWLSRFATLPPPLDLPTDRARPAMRTFASRREDHLLDAELVSRARKTASKAGSSLFAGLLATFGLLLNRLSQADEIVVGVPTAAQAMEGQGELVGHCVNLLPVRFAVDPREGAAALFRKTQTALLDAQDHARYTFGTLLRKLATPRDPSRLPLVNVTFNLDQKLEGTDLGFDGLAVSLASNPRDYENFELFVNAVQVPAGLVLECQYNADLFDQATVRRWLAAYGRLLAAACDDAERPIGQLPLLSDEEARCLLVEWSGPRERRDVTHTLASRFAEACAAAGEHPALVLDGGRLTYRELDARSNAVARHLAQAGVGVETRVGLCFERSFDLLVAMLGIVKAGGAYVPLDPAYPTDRLAFMVGDSDLDIVLADSASGAAAQAAVDKSGRGARVVPIDRIEASPGGATPAIAAPGPDTAAYVIYTSGSTGKPKGVVVTHANVIRLFETCDPLFSFGHDDVWTLFHSFAFDFSVWEIWGALLYGGRLVIVPYDVSRSPADFLRLLETERVTVLNQTPSAFYALMAEDASRTDAPALALRTVIFGGEALDLGRLRTWYERHDEAMPRLVNMYGITETTVHVTYRALARADALGAGGSLIGVPIPDLSVHLLDAGGQPVPVGVSGEIHVGGGGVARGYLNRDELTAERFVANPFGPGRLYRSGDAARWTPAGELEYLGRIDQQVKVRGFRIELGEIEASLLACPGVAQCVVTTREDRPGDVRIVAYVVPSASGVDGEALKDSLRLSLPEYMVPHHVMTIAGIPLTANGKTDRKALPRPDAGARSGAEFVAPRDEIETAVAREMENSLGMPGVGIHDDFFSLGGHSLLAAQLTSRLNRTFDIHLTMRSIFAAPTVARLAEAIRHERETPSSWRRKPLARLARRDEAPMSAMQERLWFLEELNPGRVTYNAPSAHRLTGPLDEASFARAFAEMIRRQPVLRTSFEHRDGTAIQLIHDTISFELLPAEDLSSIEPAMREAALARRLDELTAQTFDLTRAPLFKARLLRLAPEEHVLFFMPHHIIWDGWSFDLLYAELATLYTAFESGAEPRIAELPFTYGDFCAWHRDWVTGPEFAAQLAFWRARLDRLESARAMPTDWPRRPGMSGAGNTEWMVVDKVTTDALHEVGRRAGATLFQVALAAYCALLHGHSGYGNLVVGTPVRGRNALELESVMGFFNNLVPLTVDVDPSWTFLELLAHVKSVAVESFACPDVPLEQIAGDLAVRRGAGGSLLYQALFSFQDGRGRNLSWGKLEHQVIPLFQKGATEDLGLWFVESPKGLHGGVTYNTDIIAPGTAKSLHDAYLALLSAIARDPTLSVATLIGPSCAAVQHKPPAADLTMPVAKSRAGRAAGNTPPSTPTERILAEIWREQLKIPEVGVDDNFFDLGGHSLLAMQAILAMEARSGKRVDRNRYIFETLGQIARAYDEAAPASEPAPPKPGGLRGLFSSLVSGRKP